MKLRFLLCVFVLLFIHSCTKTPNPIDPTQFPLIEFDNTEYYKPSDLLNRRRTINCTDIAAYWEGKRLKMQAYVFSAGIDTVNASFVVYDNEIITQGYSAAISYAKAIDKSGISKMLVANKDNYCNLRLTCYTSSGQAIVGGLCLKPLEYHVLKATDLTF